MQRSEQEPGRHHRSAGAKLADDIIESQVRESRDMEALIGDISRDGAREPSSRAASVTLLEQPERLAAYAQ
jgi:hypothetical protein